MEALRLELFGPVRTKSTDERKVAGAYVFTHVETGEQVVGSSTGIAERSQQHIRLNSKGAVRKAFEMYDVTAFKLTMYPLPKEYQTKAMSLALEQWLFFTLKPSINMLLVANRGPTRVFTEADRKLLSERGAKKCHLYYQNRLIHIEPSLESLSKTMCLTSSHCSTLVKRYDGIYLGVFSITHEPIEGAAEDLLSVEQIHELIKATKLEYKRPAPSKPRRVNHYMVTGLNGQKWDCVGAEAVRALLKEKTGSAPCLMTLRKHVREQKAYNNYIITRKPKG
jgi:hypothetical protein